MTLDVLTDISEAREWTAVELVWLVDSATEGILNASSFGWSSDNVTWVSASVLPSPRAGPFRGSDAPC